MRLSFAKAVLLIVLVLGVGAQLLLYAAPAPLVVDKDHPEDVFGRRVSISANAFTVDMGGMRRHLNRLRVDERPEQLADWAIYATLMQAQLPPEVLSKALYDRVPYRLPSLEETASFDYGAGRRVMLPDGAVWLFIEQRDPHPNATLARLADQVRMELGQTPPRFTVFHYEVDLIAGKMQVSRHEEIAGAALFTKDYGYVEKSVHSLAELTAWMSEIDDVTHVKLVSDGIQLGGRRLTTARTLGASVEDVAALYQAHQGIAKNHEEVNKIIRDRVSPAIDAFNDLVQTYNTFNRLNGSRMNRHAFRALGAGLPELDYGFSQKLHALERMLGVELSEGSSDENKVEELRAAVVKYTDKEQQEAQLELHRAGRIMPGEPGFSLDPQWNVAGLIADLNLILTQPERIIQRARDLVKQSAGKRYEEDATPILLHQAEALAVSFSGERGAFLLAPKWRQRIEHIVRSVAGKAPLDAEKGALVPFIELKEELESAAPETPPNLSNLSEEARTLAKLLGMLTDSSMTNAAKLHGILEFLEAQHRVQCARYDGPMQGTRAAMNLFYTDLLAKLWLGVDYYHSAPTAVVPGFQSMPRIGGKIEPAYWREMQELTSTRLWFGVKPEALARTQSGDELNLAHIATRVYSAGSNPLNPGKETLAAEGSRRALGWWDRHYAQIADYEQQYHLQNQIMKWSMITGWMVEKHLIADLGDAPVDRNQRFDAWYRNNDALKFKKDVRLLPPSRWIGETECMEILRSYRYEYAGGIGAIAGGVSLGGLKTVKSAPPISETIAPAMRRGGLNYVESTLGELKTWKGTTFKLPESSPGKVVMSIGENVRLRSGPTELKVGNFETDFVRSESNAGHIALRTDKGTVAELHFTPTRNGMRMELESGALLDEQALMVRMAEERSLKNLAADPAMGQKGRYLLDTEKGPEILMTDARGSGGGAPPRSRVLRFAAEEPDSGAYAYSSGRARANVPWLEHHRLVEAMVLDEAKASEAINGYMWQRISVGPDGTAQTQVIYSAREPAANAKAVRIDTGHPLLGTLEGAIEDGTLVLKRPEGASMEAQAAWNDFVHDSGISGRDLSRLRTQADLTPAGKELHYSVPNSRSPGERAAVSFFGDDVQGTLFELAKADKNGKLSDALKDMEDSARSLRRDTVKGKVPNGGVINSGEDAKPIFGLGHEAGPGPNLGEAHDINFLPIDEHDFAGPQIKHAGDGPSPQPAKSPPTPHEPSLPQTRNSYRPPSNPSQLRNRTQPQAPMAMCADLNDDGTLDEYEREICGACEKTHRDLNRDGSVDANEERTCPQR